jgi:hypothetical protein
VVTRHDGEEIHVTILDAKGVSRNLSGRLLAARGGRPRSNRTIIEQRHLEQRHLEQ